MATYKVTNSKTGQSLRLTGDHPPTEEELADIFSRVSAQKPASAPREPQEELNFLGRYKQRVLEAPQRIEALKAKRLNPLGDAYKSMGQFTRDIFDNSEEAKARWAQRNEEAQGPFAFPKMALNTVGALGQALEGTISSTLTELQEPGAFDPVSFAKRVTANLTAEEQDEYGDVLRNMGAPEWSAQIGGLVAAGVLNPEARLARFGSTLLGGLRNKLVRSGVSKNAYTGAMTYILRSNPRGNAHLVKTGFKAVTKHNMAYGGEAAQDLGNRIYARSERLIHKPASAAFDDAAEVLNKAVISQKAQHDTVLKVFQRLDAEPNVALTDKISNLRMDYKAWLPDEKGILKEVSVRNGTFKQMALQEASFPGTTSATGKAWRNITIQLKRLARTEVPAADTVRTILDGLKLEVPELGFASKKWALWADTLHARKKLIGDVEFYRNTGRRQPTGVQKGLLKYWDADDIGANIQRSAEELDAIFKQVPGGKFTRFSDDIKDMAAVMPLTDPKTRLTAATYGGLLGVGATTAGVPGQAVAIGQAGVVGMATPRAAAFLGKKLFGETYPKTPLGKILGTLSIPGSRASAVAGGLQRGVYDALYGAGEAGAGRIITGRQ